MQQGWSLVRTVCRGILIAGWTLFSTFSSACEPTGQWKSNIGPLVIAVENGGLTVVHTLGDATGVLRGSIDGATIDLSEQSGLGDGSLHATLDAACGEMHGTYRTGGADGKFVARLIAGSIAPAVSDLATMVTSTHRLALASEDLDALAAGLDQAAIDPVALAATLGPEPDAALDWVRGNTQRINYAGLLRGARGVLLDRFGNDLDRALLLAALLEARGHSPRLAYADTALPLATTPVMIGGGAPIGFAKGYSFTPTARGRGDAEVRRIEASIEALQQQAAETKTADQVAAMSARLLEVLKQAGVSTTAPPPSASTGHWWVQVDEDGAWRDLDPDGAGMTGTATYAPDALPAELVDTVAIRVLIERSDGTALSEEPVVDQQFAAADIAGKPIELRFLDATPQPAGDIGDADPVFGPEGAVAETVWAPALIMAGQPTIDRVFTVWGTVVDYETATATGLAKEIADRAALAASVGTTNKAALGGIAGALGGVGNEVAGETPAEAPALAAMTAIVLEVTTKSPGRTEVQRRYLWDSLGADARASGTYRAPEQDDKLALARARALIGQYELLVQASNNTAPLLLMEQGKELAERGRAAAAFVDALLHNTEIERTRVPTALALLPAFYSLFRALPVDPAAALTLPNVALYRDVSPIPSQDVKGEASLDILFNGRGGRQFDQNLRLGVTDTLIEASVMGTISGNPAAAFAADPDAGADWTAIGEAELAALAAGGVQPDVVRQIEADIAAKNTVVGSLRGSDDYSWWRIGPDGTALGIGQNGAGQGKIEYVSLGARIASILNCVANLAKEYKSGKASPAKVIVNVVCIVGNMIRIPRAAGYQGPGPIPLPTVNNPAPETWVAVFAKLNTIGEAITAIASLVSAADTTYSAFF